MIASDPVNPTVYLNHDEISDGKTNLLKYNFEQLLFSREIPKAAPLPPDIQNHCDEIVHADGIVIVHPNRRGQPPAILKGWIDRVIRRGVAYEFLEEDSGEGVPRGLLKARTAVVFNTSNTEAERERTVFGDPLETIWKNCVFGVANAVDAEHASTPAFSGRKNCRRAGGNRRGVQGMRAMRRGVSESRHRNPGDESGTHPAVP